MNTFASSCTAPGRWEVPPAADAPEAEIVAYLEHCDACAYHARQADRQGEAFDALLREACAGLPMPVVRRRRRLAERYRRDRPAFVDAPGERAGFERRLAQACLLAFCIVVGWVAYTAPPAAPPARESLVDAAPPGWDARTLSEAQLAAAVERGRLFMVGVIHDGLDGQPTKSGVPYDRHALVAASPRLPFGSRLRVTNPISGASVEVTVVDRGPQPGQLTLSSAAAAALGFEGRLLAIVEVLSQPPPPLFGP